MDNFCQTDEYETEVSSPSSEGGGGAAMTELAPMIPQRKKAADAICRELPRRRGSGAQGDSQLANILG